MVGRKSNLKFLMSKLREVGVTIVKTTEFVQGQTCRWGLAWSFMPTAKRLVPSHAAEKSNLSFMLEVCPNFFVCVVLNFYVMSNIAILLNASNSLLANCLLVHF